MADDVRPHPDLTPDDFAAMLSASQVCVLVHESYTKDILWANPAACRMLEFSLSEIRPLKAPDMSSPAREYSRATGRAWLQRAVDEGSSSTEWHYRSKSGRVIPTAAVATRVELAQGPVVMVQFRDIEREQSMERTLQRTEEYFHALARQTAAGAIALTEDGVVEYASDNALLQLRAERNDVVGQNIGEFCEIDAARGKASWAEVIASAQPFTPVRLHIASQELGEAWLEGSLDRVDASGSDILLLTLRDITQQVVDDHAHGREVEYENYLSRYNAMGDMAMAIAHELGQPLAAASNFLTGARMRAAQRADLNGAHRGAANSGPEPTSADDAFALEAARKQIDRASAIVKALREFVGHLEKVRMLVDLNEVVADSLYFIRLRSREAGVRIEQSLYEHRIPVQCERVLTGQVVMNLCFNAIEEMARWPEADRLIRVSTRIESGHGWFTVEDQGAGLSQLNPSQIFDQSFTSKEHGSGIGLALSHRIITRQHGQIFARSRDPRGSVFSFSLPLVERDPEGR